MPSLTLDRLTTALEVLALLEEWAVVEEALEATELVAPYQGALLRLRARCWIARGATSRAWAALRRSVHRNPLDTRAWSLLAHILPPGAEQTMAAQRARLPRTAGVEDLFAEKPYLALAPLMALSAAHPDWAECSLWQALALAALDAHTEAQALLVPWRTVHPPLTALHWLDCLWHDAPLQTAAAIDPLGECLRALIGQTIPAYLYRAPPDVPVSQRVMERIQLLPPDVVQPEVPLPQWSAKTLLRQEHLAGVEQSARPPDTPHPSLVIMEEARQRVFGTAVRPLGADHEAAVLIMHRGRILQHAPDHGPAILQHLTTLTTVLQTRNIHAVLVALDDPTTWIVSETHDLPKDEGRETLRQLIPRLAGSLLARGYQLTTVWLIGGPTLVPWHLVANPSHDPDRTVPSDNPNGTIRGSFLVPDLIVARLPDGGDDQGVLLAALITKAITRHRGSDQPLTPASLLPRWIQRPPVRTPPAFVAWGRTAEAWQVPSQRVLGAFAADAVLHQSPPRLTRNDFQAAATPQVWFFNLHGLPSVASWYGQPHALLPGHPLPEAVALDAIPAQLPGGICVTEACYGADILKRSVDTSIVLRLLAAGVDAVVGSTCIAYGAVGLPIGGADILLQATLHGLRRGLPIGAAVREARQVMARKAAPVLDPEEAKTLLSFVLLGDPWAGGTGGTRLVDKQAAVPAVEVDTRQPTVLVNPAVLGRIQRYVQRWLPYFSDPVTPQGTVLFERPQSGLMAKDGRASAIIYTIRVPFATADGQTGHHLARLTLEADEPRLLLVSR